MDYRDFIPEGRLIDTPRAAALQAIIDGGNTPTDAQIEAICGKAYTKPPELMRALPDGFGGREWGNPHWPDLCIAIARRENNYQLPPL